MKDKTKNWLRIGGIVSVLAIIIILSTRSCSSTFVADVLKDITPNTEAVIKRDTVRIIDTLIRIEIDTVYQKEIVYLEKIVRPAPDTVFIVKEDTIRQYAGVSEDSTVLIDYAATVKGELEDLQLGYKLKAPRLIEKTITQTIRDSITITTELYKGGFYLGSGLRYTPTFEPSPSIEAGYLTKKGWYYGGRYEPTTKTIGIAVQKRIF